MNIQPISFTSRYKSTFKAPKNRKIEYDKEAFDSTLRRINADVTNPCAYHIYDIENRIPKTIENAAALEGFYEGMMDYDQFLAQISYNNICRALDSKYDARGDIVQKATKIEQSLMDGDSDASTYEMLLDSVKNKEILPNAFFGLEQKAWFKDDFLEDLNKYYEAKASNQDIEGAFVPKFTSKDDALVKTPRGGVFCLEDKNNIFIKTDDDEAKELFITPKTYLELFPPLEKNALAQGRVGDCFFISSIQALYSNLKTRNLVLEMFNESPDGTLKVSLAGYKKEGDKVVLKDKKAYEITDASAEMKNYNKKRLAFQYEGMRLLEMCVDKTTRTSAYERILDQYNLYKSLIEIMKDDDEVIELEDGLKYTKKEMRLFTELFEKCGDIGDIEKITNSIISLEDSFITSEFKDYFFDEDAIIDTTFGSMEELDYTQEEYEYLGCVLNRYKQYFKDNPDVKKVKLNDFITPNCHMAIQGIAEDFDYITKGGSAAEVMKRLGLKARKLDEEEIKDFFMQPDLNSNYIMVASSSKRYPEPNIMPAHAYSLRADKIGDMSIICAQNPHNSAQDILMTPQTAGIVFNDVYIAEI